MQTIGIALLALFVATIVSALLAVIATGIGCDVLPIFMDVSGFIDLSKCP